MWMCWLIIFVPFKMFEASISIRVITRGKKIKKRAAPQLPLGQDQLYSSVTHSLHTSEMYLPCSQAPFSRFALCLKQMRSCSCFAYGTSYRHL